MGKVWLLYINPWFLGELLAAFEMFELGDSSRPLPPIPPVKTEASQSTGPIMPIPPEIRPTLVKYRLDKEVKEVETKQMRALYLEST